MSEYQPTREEIDAVLDDIMEDKKERTAHAGQSALRSTRNAKLGYLTLLDLATVAMIFARLLRRLWLRLMERPAERVYQQPCFFAFRADSYYCSECDTIGADARSCPRCRSTALLNVSRVLCQDANGIRMEAQ